MAKTDISIAIPHGTYARVGESPMTCELEYTSSLFVH